MFGARTIIRENTTGQPVVPAYIYLIENGMKRCKNFVEELFMYDEFEQVNPSMTEMGGKRKVELKMALRSFLAQCGASCFEDEDDKDVLKCYSRLQNGMFVEQEIHVGDGDYLCYTNLSGRLKTDDPDAVTATILAANGVNRELKYGNFEVDGKSGAVRFRSYYEPVNDVRLEELDRLVGEPLWAIENYGNYFA